MTFAATPYSAPGHLTGPAPLLSVRHLRVAPAAARRGPQRQAAVEDFHLDLRYGEVIAVIGEPESGRPELALALAGRLAGLAGSIRYDGNALRPASPAADCALVAPGAFAGLHMRKAPTGVRWFMDAVAAVLPQASEEQRALRMSSVLGRVGLIASDLHRPLPQFDASVAARLVLASTLLKPLRLLIVDEPVSGYDLVPFATLVRGLQAEHGFALIYGTRDPQLALSLGQRVLVLFRGRVVESAPVSELVDRPRHPYVRLLLGEEALTSAARDMEPGGLDDSIPVQGCNFHPHCPLADPMCIGSAPGLRRVGDEHYAACHFVAAS